MCYELHIGVRVAIGESRLVYMFKTSGSEKGGVDSGNVGEGGNDKNRAVGGGQTVKLGEEEGEKTVGGTAGGGGSGKSKGVALVDKEQRGRDRTGTLEDSFERLCA